MNTSADPDRSADTTGTAAPQSRALPSTSDFGTAPQDQQWPTGAVPEPASPGSPTASAPAGKAPDAEGLKFGLVLGSLVVGAVVTAVIASGNSSTASAPVHHEEQKQISEIAEQIDPALVEAPAIDAAAAIANPDQRITILLDSPDDETGLAFVTRADGDSQSDYGLGPVTLPHALTFEPFQEGDSLTVSVMADWRPEMDLEGLPRFECRILLGDTLLEYNLGREHSECSISYEDIRPAESE